MRFKAIHYLKKIVIHGECSFLSFNAVFALQKCFLWIAETKGQTYFQKKSHYSRMTYCIFNSQKTKSYGLQ